MAQLTAALWPLGVKPDAWLRPLSVDDQRSAGEALQLILRSARRPRRPASEREKLHGRSEAAKAAARDETAEFSAAAKARLVAGGRGAYSGAVMILLRDAPHGLSLAQLRIALDGLPGIGPMIHHYTKRGHVDRRGVAGAYVYALTAKGRAMAAKAR